MRLLNLSHKDHISLTRNLDDDERPLYAILSHTWAIDNEEEVTFSELGTILGQGKPGFKKIRFCGEQARRDGIEHFWVDTCCINKDSQSELQEAITSMYRWYQTSVKCYVYLPDVSTHNMRSDWLPDFRSSRWFRRGWTLQELLAPKIVEFYSREGICLGTKESLASEIQEITTIPLAALRNTPLIQFPVDERIRWTQNRQTKKEEDKAYCLMGMFGVFMPLIYGERDNAIRRLQNEINKRHAADVAAGLDLPQHQLSSGMFPKSTLLDQIARPVDSFERAVHSVVDQSSSTPQHDGRGLQVSASLHASKQPFFPTNNGKSKHADSRANEIEHKGAESTRVDRCIAMLDRVEDILQEAFVNGRLDTFQERIDEWLSTSEQDFVSIELAPHCSEDTKLIAAEIFQRWKGPKLVYIQDPLETHVGESCFGEMLDALIPQLKEYLPRQDLGDVCIMGPSSLDMDPRSEYFKDLCFAVLDRHKDSHEVWLVLEGIEVNAEACIPLAKLYQLLIAAIRSINSACKHQGSRLRTVLVTAGRGQLLTATDTDVDFISEL